MEIIESNGVAGNLNNIPVVNLATAFGRDRLFIDGNGFCLAGYGEAIRLLPTIQHQLDGGHSGAFEENVVSGVPPNVGDTRGCVKIVNL